MTKRLEVDKEYWFKGKVAYYDEKDTYLPYQVELFGTKMWVPKENEAVEVIPESEKVTIPKEVAEWIEEHKGQFSTVYTAFSILTKREYGIKKWVNDNQDTFDRALLDGYEVDKEKLYTVEIPNPESVYPMVLYKTDDGGVILGTCYSPDNWEKLERNQLTESEIKKDFDWAWQFAVPVEE